MEKLLPSFEESLFDSNLIDSGIDIAEIGIDSIIDNPILNSISFVKTILGIAKTAQNIYDRNLIKQTLSFIKGYNSGELEEEKINAYRKKITNDTKKAEEELGRVMVILNKTVESKKSLIMGRLFQAYVMGNIDWNTFCDLSDATDSMFLSDIPILLKTQCDGLENPDSNVSYRADRLAALGLVKTGSGTADAGEGALRFFSYAKITKFGELFVNYGIDFENEGI